ncbi:gluconate 2-dehydrogenase subunit 3 family protein (plasmid) [Rhizobium sp. CB3090]|uniref:gluconate 2-dehydrogenase subunit 3 family protein n=1 Tax=Rhizobium sp. CB3090 TaxID=3039156 RepID=UPI0024B14FD8|nr:gluconate 2-dehydrogenase subunit 3 family protein [Rhizobium sp. CB3090]WFU11697.1 gluconate 2-dehydrogenase subunit 3 family protein [Rhizobium sp. CB3090]
MKDRYPGYDVLRKRGGVSWNDKTRTVIEERTAIDPVAHEHLDAIEWRTLVAICDRIIPQNVRHETPVPIAAMIDSKLTESASEGYRDARLPPLSIAWKQGLAAIEDEAKLRSRRSFAGISDAEKDALLTHISRGYVRSPLWSGLPADVFFSKRLLHDIVSAYYAFPAAWNEIGFGGPASPRGYVRLGFDRRDPWEASEAKPGQEVQARRENARIR